MTNLEALKALIAIPVEERVFAKALIDLELNADDEYSAANKVKINEAGISLLQHVKQLRTFSEGDLSYGVSESAIDSMIESISGETVKPVPKIYNAPNRW